MDVLKHFETAGKNRQYRSPIIQNQMIDCCKKYIQDDLVDEIKDPGYFSIIADEAKDVSNLEQLSIVFRFVDSKTGDIREEFFGVMECEKLDGKSIALLIEKCVCDAGLDMNNVRGLCFDGASNMSRRYQGASACIKRKYHLALYFHCASHRLNLSVAGACNNICSVKKMMSCIKKCTDIFHFSPKKQLKLSENFLDVHPAEMHTKLKDVCRTRWLERLDGFDRIWDLYEPILVTLDHIGSNLDGTYQASASVDTNGVFSYMSSFEFLITLHIVRNCLAYVYPLTYELQQKKIDIISIYRSFENVISTLMYVRDDLDKKHTDWYEEAVKKAGELDIPIKFPHRIVSRQENYNASSVSEYYCYSVSANFLDFIINDLSTRFSPEHRIHANGHLLVPPTVINNCNRKEGLGSFIDKYGINQMLVLAEFANWETYWNKELEMEREIPDNITDTLIAFNGRKHWFPNIYSMLCIIAAVPGSSNSCERSISKLRLIKDYKRSTMANDRLTGLALLNVHYEKELDIDRLIDVCF